MQLDLSGMQRIGQLIPVRQPRTASPCSSDAPRTTKGNSRTCVTSGAEGLKRLPMQDRDSVPSRQPCTAFPGSSATAELSIAGPGGMRTSRPPRPRHLCQWQRKARRQVRVGVSSVVCLDLQRVTCHEQPAPARGKGPVWCLSVKRPCPRTSCTRRAAAPVLQLGALICFKEAVVSQMDGLIKNSFSLGKETGARSWRSVGRRAPLSFRAHSGGARMHTSG
jgi:hypothetical protein